MGSWLILIKTDDPHAKYGDNKLHLGKKLYSLLLMKNFGFILIVFCLSFISCSTNDPSPVPVEPEVVLEDAYNYLVLRHDGQMFEIGDKTGKIKTINKIPNIDLLNMNSVTTSSTKLYFYEHKFPPLQPVIYEYDFQTKSSRSHNIVFSELEFGPFAGLETMEWDAGRKGFIAIVRANYGENRPDPGRLAFINAETFKVSSLNIDVPQKYIMGTLIRGNEIFASSYRSNSSEYVSDFFKINLQTGLMTNIEVDGMTIAPIHLSQNPGKNTLFGFLPVHGSSYMGASKPVVFDPETGIVKQLFPNEVIGNYNRSGRSFFNSQNKEHVDLITSPDYLALFRYNSDTQEVVITKLPHPNDLGTENTIVAAVKL